MVVVTGVAALIVATQVVRVLSGSSSGGSRASTVRGGVFAG